MRAGGEYVEVCRASEVAPGEMRAVQVGGERVVVANVGGEFFAVGAVCTHEHAYLDEGMVLDDQIYCPRHFSSFDLRTGRVCAAPAEAPLPVYEVSVEDDRVLVGPGPGGGPRPEGPGPLDGAAPPPAVPVSPPDAPGPPAARRAGVTSRVAAWTVVDRLSTAATSVVAPLRRRYGATPAVDLLHGRWLGHPLHPALSDLPIGLGVGAVVLAARRRTRRGARTLRWATLVSGLAAAATGITDWSVSEGTARRAGALHGALNLAGLAASAVAVGGDLVGARRLAARAHAGGVGVMVAAAYLGGDLVLGRGVMVDHTAWTGGPAEWTDAGAAEEVRPGEVLARTVGGRDVLLYRAGEGGPISAIEGACTHAGGPLRFGQVCEGVVTCPWHGSRFALRDGGVVGGPACFPQPAFETRVREGRVEVRRPLEVAG